MEPTPLGPATLPHTSHFSALSPQERRQLESWSELARNAGIDGVEDLGARPWPVETAASILGVYRVGENFASWLVVGRDGDWSVASCADSAVIGSGRSLIDALAFLHPMNDEHETF